VENRIPDMNNSYGIDIQSAIADMLRAERAIQEMTLDELAEKAGMPKVTLQRYLKAQRDIPLKSLADICRALDVPMGEVIQRAEERLQAKKLHEGETK